MSIRYMIYNPNAMINGTHWSENVITDNMIANSNIIGISDSMMFIDMLIDAIRTTNEKNNDHWDLAIVGIEFEA